MLYEQEYIFVHLSENFIRWMRSRRVRPYTRTYWAALWKEQIYPALGTKKVLTADDILSFLREKKEVMGIFELKALYYLILSVANYGKEHGTLGFEEEDIHDRVAELLKD